MLISVVLLFEMSKLSHKF